MGRPDQQKALGLTVFTTPIDPKLEEDVQWVFIKSLSLRDGTLGITSERGKTYQIDLKTKLVTQSDLTSPQRRTLQRNAMTFLRRSKELSRMVRPPRSTMSRLA
jgi:hypothetical protein